MPDGLAGRVAIVTGGSSGIGLAIAGALVEAGVLVAIAARGRVSLDVASVALNRKGGPQSTIAIPTDTRDQQQVDALVAEVEARHGSVDILVTCAASPSGVTGSIEDLDADALVHDLDVKVAGYARCIRAAAPIMKRQGRGRIICIGGFTGKTSDTLSGMRNVAVSHLVKTVADQLGPFGATVNALHPGIVRTPHLEELFAKEATARALTIEEVEAEFVANTPVRRVLTPEEVAATAVFLASDAAASITGQSITIDGGLVRGVYL